MENEVFHSSVKNQHCLPAGRSRAGSDSPPDCHSVPAVPFEKGVDSRQSFPQEMTREKPRVVFAKRNAYIISADLISAELYHGAAVRNGRGGPQWIQQIII